MDPLIKGIVLVATGGFLGGITRYALNRTAGNLPGTMIANITACAIIGITPTHLILAIGFAGACSTFSTLAQHTGTLLKHHHPLHALTYLTTTLTLSFAAFHLTHALTT